jgi:hypothetical protein
MRANLRTQPSRPQVVHGVMRIALALVVVVASLTLARPADAQVRAGLLNPQTGPVYGSPVQVESCELDPQIPMAARAGITAGLGVLAARMNSTLGYIVAGTAGAAVISGQLESGATLRITVANEGNVPADLVRVRAIGTTGELFERAALTLAPGQVTTLRYHVPGATMQPRQTTCSIDLVHFVDGSTWSAQVHPQLR